MQHQPQGASDPDLDLLRAVARGDAAACGRLVDRHLLRLHRFACRLLDDAAEAEDVCQEAFVKLWQIAPRWQAERAQVSTWLYQVALNACRDRLRRRRESSDEVDALPAGAPQPAQQAERDERRRRVQIAVAGLPARQREALLLFHFEGLSQSQAAAALAISEDALESLLARARRSLRQRLSDDAGACET